MPGMASAARPEPAVAYRDRDARGFVTVSQALLPPWWSRFSPTRPSPLLGLPEIVVLLHLQPEHRPVACKLADP